METWRRNSSEEKVQDEEAKTLKERISTHPLYGLLVQAHMDCLKVGSIGDLVDQSYTMKKHTGTRNTSCSLSQPELDHFMEAYCFALSKLKEAMEEPQKETAAFIKSMHLQLSELTRAYPAAAEASTTLAG
ncbi:hypothetical protein Tsubulata_031351 [Turnera subulata]|uniref:KNOX2 domain-containing protein n=1 Tax=Turnera subulata TaxID=218843 RepID=A0A9Q0FS11_9ROSI|nr:hypothetical protein Tsubulata_031351 [Turnera subulata]